MSQSLEKKTAELIISLLSLDIQGARGFPGTPGLPGIKGHRVSFCCLCCQTTAEAGKPFFVSQPIHSTLRIADVHTTFSL